MLCGACSPSLALGHTGTLSPEHGHTQLGAGGGAGDQLAPWGGVRELDPQPRSTRQFPCGETCYTRPGTPGKVQATPAWGLGACME